MSRPGGNVTGMSIFNLSLAEKRLELLKELIPTAAVIGYLVNPTSPSGEAESTDAHAAARALGVQRRILNASTEHDLDAVFASLVQLRADALLVAGEPFFDSRRDRLVALSARHSIPASYAWREYVAVGGLMSYGTSLTDSYRQGGIYVARILKGEKPAHLPVMQANQIRVGAQLEDRQGRFDLPPTLLARADEVIE